MPARSWFRLLARDGRARCGELITPHGVVRTPAFVPVGTHGVVKAVTPAQLDEVGAEIILANTYHLYLRPGAELIARRGGLHRFAAWPRPILTDSGGYQVFSLAHIRRIGEEGVQFQSHLDGSSHLLTPEKAVEIQAHLGSDVAMVLDECIGYPADPAHVRDAMRRTLRWARRSRDRFLTLRGREPFGRAPVPVQMQFGIVQGGVSADLRSESVAGTTAMDFEGYAIGGLSVGEAIPTMYDVVATTAPMLPEERPRYLMGTGTPTDLVECVARGIDLFDCVLPTRNARNGQLFTSEGRIIIKNAQYAEDDAPPDPACRCYTCRHFSRAYLRHLYMAREMTVATLNTLHNLHFYLDTMRRIREAIMFGSFETFRQEFYQRLSRL